MTVQSLSYLLASWTLGIVLAYAIPFRLPAWSRLLWGPALGMIFSAELTFFLALFFRFDATLILIGILLFAAIAFCVLRNFRSTPLPDSSFSESVRDFLRAWPLWTLLLTIGSIVIYIYFTRVLAPGPQGLIISQGGLFGDTAFHLAQITGFAYQGVPISNPFYAGIPLRYPFLVNFYAACLFKLGMSLRYVLILPQILNFVAFVTLFHLLAKRFTNSAGVFFSFLLFFLGWGLGFVDYFMHSILSGNWAMTHDYTNDETIFRMHNFITGLALPQRAILSGFVIGLLLTVCFLYQDGPFSRKQGVWLGILLGILPLWHGHSFLFMCLSLSIWIVFRYGNEWRKHLDGILIFLSVACALSLPIMLWFGQQISPVLRLQAGWTHPEGNLILFWFKNTGFIIPLALLSLLQTMKTNRYVFLPALAMFIAANVIVFQPWDWDNIKLLEWALLFAAILTGNYLSRLFSRGLGFKLLTFMLLFTLTASGSLSIARLVSRDFIYYMYDRYDLQIARWAARDTSPSSVFLISDVPAHPVTGLAGRTAYLGYPGHLWSHGIDYRPRLALEKRILSGDLSALKEMEIPVEYIVAERSQPLNRQQNNLSVCFENPKYSVYRVRAH